jgi:hypothetical protein
MVNKKRFKAALGVAGMLAMVLATGCVSMEKRASELNEVKADWTSPDSARNNFAVNTGKADSTVPYEGQSRLYVVSDHHDLAFFGLDDDNQPKGTLQTAVAGAALGALGLATDSAWRGINATNGQVVIIPPGKHTAHVGYTNTGSKTQKGLMGETSVANPPIYFKLDVLFEAGRSYVLYRIGGGGENEPGDLSIGTVESYIDKTSKSEWEEAIGNNPQRSVRVLQSPLSKPSFNPFAGPSTFTYQAVFGDYAGYRQMVSEQWKARIADTTERFTWMKIEDWQVADAPSEPPKDTLEELENHRKERASIARYLQRTGFKAERKKWYVLTAEERPGETYYVNGGFLADDYYKQK